MFTGFIHVAGPSHRRSPALRLLLHLHSHRKHLHANQLPPNPKGPPIARPVHQLPIQRVPPLKTLHRTHTKQVNSSRPRPRLPKMQGTHKEVLSLRVQHKHVNQNFPPDKDTLHLLRSTPSQQVLSIPRNTSTLRRHQYRTFHPQHNRKINQHISPPQATHPLLLLTSQLITQEHPTQPSKAQRKPPNQGKKHQHLFQLRRNTTRQATSAVQRHKHRLIQQRLKSKQRSQVQLTTKQALQTSARVTTQVPSRRRPPSHAIQEQEHTNIQAQPTKERRNQVFKTKSRPPTTQGIPSSRQRIKVRSRQPGLRVNTSTHTLSHENHEAQHRPTTRRQSPTQQHTTHNNSQAT